MKIFSGFGILSSIMAFLIIEISDMAQILFNGHDIDLSCKVVTKFLVLIKSLMTEISTRT